MHTQEMPEIPQRQLAKSARLLLCVLNLLLCTSVSATGRQQAQAIEAAAAQAERIRALEDQVREFQRQLAVLQRQHLEEQRLRLLSEAHARRQAEELDRMSGVVRTQEALITDLEHATLEAPSRAGVVDTSKDVEEW